MKVSILIIFITLCSLCQAQEYSDKNILLLKNGETIEFYGPPAVNKGKLRVTLDENYQDYYIKHDYKKVPLETIESITLSAEMRVITNGINETYSIKVGKVIKYKKKEIFVYELVGGNCSLYFFGDQLGANYVYNFFVKRKGEELATKLHGSSMTNNKYKKVTPKYFADCAEVVQEFNNIKVKNYENHLLPEFARVVELYNTSCNNNE